MALRSVPLHSVLKRMSTNLAQVSLHDLPSHLSPCCRCTPRCCEMSTRQAVTFQYQGRKNTSLTLGWWQPLPSLQHHWLWYWKTPPRPTSFHPRTLASVGWLQGTSAKKLKAGEFYIFNRYWVLRFNLRAGNQVWVCWTNVIGCALPLAVELCQFISAEDLALRFSSWTSSWFTLV